MNRISSHQKGLSLFELLLVVGVMAFMLTGAVKILDGWFLSTVDREVASEISRLQDAAENYVELNFSTILGSSVPTVNSVSEIAIADLIADGFLPNGYNAINSYRQNMRVFVRHATNSAIYGSVLEVVTLSEGEPVSDSRIYNAASNGGPSVGVISTSRTTSGNWQIRNSSGAWTLDLSDFSAPATSYNAVPNAEGGFVAAYGRITDERALTEQYLFRVEDAAFPQANRMDTNIDMNYHNVVNANMAVVDSMVVGGDATITGVEPDGTRTSHVLSVRDDFQTRNLNITSDGDTTKGNVYIDGDNNVGTDFRVVNALHVNNNNAASPGGNVSANSLNTQRVTISNNAIFSNVNMGGNNLSASGNIYSRRLRLGSSLEARNLQTTNVVDGFNTIATDTTAARSISVIGNGNAVNLNTNTNIENNLNVGGQATISNTIRGRNDTTITRMTRCGSGCP